MSLALLKRLLKFGHVKIICGCARSVKIVNKIADHDGRLEFGPKIMTVQRDARRC